ncbi:MAG: hypothetical protein PHH32_03195 [Eubacteriales bacterium]|nr:hypothetical protein [Eubacteriales bacterium]
MASRKLYLVDLYNGFTGEHQQIDVMATNKNEVLDAVAARTSYEWEIERIKEAMK